MKKTSRKAAKPKRSSAKPDLNRYPKGWNRKRVQEVIAHYENQTEDEAVAEDEASYNDVTISMMAIPVELVPAVQQLIKRRRAS